MHTVEAPERWFEDIGRAQLREGVARVDIDPDFAAVSGLGDDYHVFLTAEGPSNGLYVADRTSTGFEVREQAEGRSDISFSYRIMTRSADPRTGRLDRIELPSEEGQRIVARAVDHPTGPLPPSATPPAASPPSSPSSSPGLPVPVQPENARSGESLPEEGLPEPPSDWPESVPWPAAILTTGMRER
jgi:hypothetical protein